MTDYLEIPWAPGYRVGTDGSVWSRWQRGRWRRLMAEWRRLRTPPGTGGYPRLNLYTPAGRLHVKLHQLVLSVFVGPLAPGLCVRHINGDCSDCRLENLAYGTSSDNAADAVRLGRTNRGERSPSARLTAIQVAEIRRRVEAGEMPGALAVEFGVGVVTVYDLLRRRTWRHL